MGAVCATLTILPVFTINGRRKLLKQHIILTNHFAGFSHLPSLHFSPSYIIAASLICFVTPWKERTASTALTCCRGRGSQHSSWGCLPPPPTISPHLLELVCHISSICLSVPLFWLEFMCALFTFTLTKLMAKLITAPHTFLLFRRVTPPFLLSWLRSMLYIKHRAKERWCWISLFTRVHECCL